MRYYTVTFSSGKTDTFKACGKTWIGCALGRNQRESLQTIADVSTTAVLDQ